MNLVQALQCPYCEGALFKESYAFRCARGHRFTVAYQPPPPPAAGDDLPGDAFAADALAGAALTGGGAPPGALPQAAPRTPGRYALRVLRHADRREIGRVHAFTVGEE